MFVARIGSKNKTDIKNNSSRIINATLQTKNIVLLIFLFSAHVYYFFIFIILFYTVSRLSLAIASNDWNICNAFFIKLEPNFVDELYY